MGCLAPPVLAWEPPFLGKTRCSTPRPLVSPLPSLPPASTDVLGTHEPTTPRGALPWAAKPQC